MGQLSPLALIVCDSIYAEVPNGTKPALIGLFTLVQARSYPVTHPKMCVLASVVGAEPGMVFKLEIAPEEGGEPIVSVEGVAPNNIGLDDVFEMHFELRSVVFPAPGQYLVKYWGGSAVVVQRRLKALLVKEKEGDNK